MCATSNPLELRFHAFLVVLLTTRNCKEFTGEPWTKWTSHLFHLHVHKGFLKQLLGSKQQRYLQRNNIFNEATWSRFQQVSIQRSPHDVITPFPPPTPRSANNNATCNVTTSSTKQHPQGFNKSQSNAVHMTLLHPSHPPPPFCKQQRYTQRNNIFNEATSSRFQQVSIQRSPHDVITPPLTPPPLIPHLYTITTFIVHDKTEGSWKLRGTPSLEPIYIYIHILFKFKLYQFVSIYCFKVLSNYISPYVCWPKDPDLQRICANQNSFSWTFSALVVRHEFVAVPGCREFDVWGQNELRTRKMKFGLVRSRFVEILNYSVTVWLYISSWEDTLLTNMFWSGPEN